MRYGTVLVFLLVFALPANGQTTPSNKPFSVEEALAAYDQTARALEMKLHDAQQKIADLTQQLDAKGLEAKTEAEHRARIQEDNRNVSLNIAASESSYRLGLVTMLQQMDREDAELEKALLNKKFKITLDTVRPPVTMPTVPPLAARATTELVHLVRERIGNRDILIRALMADRLGAAGQDVLDAGQQPH